LDSSGIRPFRDRRLAISAATIAYVSAERDLFRRWGPTAVRHLTVDDRRMLARLAHNLGWRQVKRHACIATVGTLRHWWRDLVQDPQASPRRGGRKAVCAETMNLVLDMARDNSLGNDAWGRRRIRDELLQLGIRISDSTVRRILLRHGMPPAPERGRSWDGPAAVAAHDPRTVALDFTKVTVGHGTQAKEMFLLAGIHIGSREVEIFGVTDHPNGPWMAQIARNITMDETGFLRRVGAKAVLMDRDRSLNAQFRHMLKTAGFPVFRTPKACPWCNGYIERFWQTIKNGIIRKAIWLDELALLQAVTEYAHHHYLRERPHQALGGIPPKPAKAILPDPTKPVVRQDRLGGLIHVYRRAA
jgi:transposase InsO family protein